MAEPKQVLTPPEIVKRMKDLPGWSLENNALVRTYLFPDYLPGLDFVSRLAHEADRMDHHPRIVLDIKMVTVEYSTHSAGGITPLDFEGAKTADRLMGVGHVVTV